MRTQYTHQAQLFGSKFVPGDSGSGPVLMVADTVYWENHEREILNWMAEHMTNGIEHQQGSMIMFESEQQRLMFLLKWG